MKNKKEQFIAAVIQTQLFTRKLPDEDVADLCLRCHEYTMWPEPHRALNPLSKTRNFEDADDYICPLCGQEEDIRHLRQHIKDMTHEEKK